MKAHRITIFCSVLALAACGGSKEKETGGKAGGEILPASVDDAMLPHDTVRSQAPFAPSAEGGAAGKDRNGAKPEAKQAAEDAPAAAPTGLADQAEPAE